MRTASPQPLLLLLPLLLCSCWQWRVSQAQAAPCGAGRSLSQLRYGFAKAAAQGSNDSFVYVALLVDVSSPAASGVGCGVGNDSGVTLASMQKVEAALWSISTFRSRFAPSSASLLPGVSVGALILDACGSAARGAQLVANLQTCETAFGSAAAGSVPPGSVVAFVGVDSDAVAGSALPLLGAANRATLSYQLTSPAYSRATQPLTALLSPSDTSEAEALAQATRGSGARHAQLLYGAAGRRVAMATALAARLAELGVCVANRRQYSSSPASSAASVVGFAGVRPVLLLLDAEELRGFVDEMLRLRPAGGEFSWILASELSPTAEGLAPGREAFFAGALLLRQYATASGFENFQSAFRSLRPDAAGSSEANPWLADYWSRRFACNVPGGAGGGYARNCNFADASQNLQSTSEFDASAARVVQATDMALHSLELVRRSSCGASSVGLCAAFFADANRFRSVYENLFNVKASLGYSDVELSAATARPAAYTFLLRNFQRRGSAYVWTTVGSFVSGTLLLTSPPMAYGAGGAKAAWTSACGAACLAVCPTAATTPATTTPSASGGNGTGLEQLRFRRQYWVYALIVCASVGVVVCLMFAVYILINVLGLPEELKSFNTLWSGQFLLLVLLLGYVTLFAWVPWPTPEFCGIVRFMVGFLYAAIYTILMVKLLNLINEYLTPVYQVLLFFFGLAVQVSTTVEWLLLAPSSVVWTDTGSRCSHSFNDHLLTLIYCMLLILICALLAIRAHSIGRNNREATFIGCTAGLSIPVWIAWTLVGGLNQGQNFKDASIAFGLFANLTLVLLVIFIPKVYQLRRLEDEEEEEEASSESSVSPYDEDTKEPIYMLTQATPSVRSEPRAPISVLADGQLRPVSQQPRTLSEAGDRQVDIGLQLPEGRKTRRAYSEYNYQEADDARRTAAAMNETKAQRMARLGFL